VNSNIRLKNNIRNLCNLYCLLIENLFKPELIENYNKIHINNFIENSFNIFEKNTQKDQIIDSYRKMKINIDRLIKKKNGDDEDEETVSD